MQCIAQKPATAVWCTSGSWLVWDMQKKTITKIVDQGSFGFIVLEMTAEVTKNCDSTLQSV